MTALNSGLAVSASPPIQALAVQAGDRGNLSHAVRTRDEAKGVARKIRVAGLERRRDVCDLTFFGAESVGRIESGGLRHHKVSAGV